MSGLPAKNDDLLPLSLSSKGGEGNSVAASEHRDTYKEQTAAGLAGLKALFPVNARGDYPYSPDLRGRAGRMKLLAGAAYENVVFRN
jgi:hypothetical protein